MPPAWKIDAVNGDQISGGGAGSLAAVAGYPHLTVPMGLVKGLPVGLSFIGPQMVGRADALARLRVRAGARRRSGTNVHSRHRDKSRRSRRTSNRHTERQAAALRPFDVRLRRSFRRHAAVDKAAQHAAEERRQPEDPELLQRHASDDEGRPRAPRRVHRRVRHRNRDQVDKQSVRRPIARGAKPAGARLWVEPMMIIRKKAVITISVTTPACIE